jgi:hypothetical protein
MAWKAGDEIIVTTHGVNHVGVVLDRRVINKTNVYDILLENRSAYTFIGSAPSATTYINRGLTAKLIDTEIIQSTIPYKELLAAEELPICHPNA